jgi:isopenicillin N synthase-like dioxygenase
VRLVTIYIGNYILTILVLTFLAPGKVRALEVLNRDGQWISAPPIEGTYVVNVGDQLQRYVTIFMRNNAALSTLTRKRLTNNLYISTKHRVINHTGEERLSIPFFFSANWDLVIDASRSNDRIVG